MSQPSVASYFNTRKRAANDDSALHKNKLLLENTITTEIPSHEIPQNKDEGVRTRSGRVVKRVYTNTPSPSDVVLAPKKKSKLEQKNLVEFIKKGTLSPRKKNSPITPQKQTTTTIDDVTQDKSSVKEVCKNVQNLNEATPSTQQAQLTDSKKTTLILQQGMRTPTKQIIKGSGNAPRSSGEILNLVKKELNFDEVKTKVSRSAKLQELKKSLARIQELEKTRKAQEEHNRRLKENLLSPAKKPAPSTVQLKEFKTIELELLTSPSKTFKTPTKLPPATPDKNELMSPRHTDASKRLLFSPAKNGSPSKLIVPPAYQRFQSLLGTSQAGKLPMPFKYRNLIDIFKAVDSVCAMFHNRRECITFKKLKPAVQRMLRKNFNEVHLAQIKHLFPEAYHFTQMKMRNYGSVSKSDYFQLVIAPNVSEQPGDRQPSQEYFLNSNMAKIDEDNVLAQAQSQAMNPHVMTQRLQRLQMALLQLVHAEHDKFLKSLDPPLNIAKEKVTRWHPDFDLENCPDVPTAHIPQPPNVEKYSSAKDILSTARNLFNCATPMERVMERYEAKLKAEEEVMQNMKNSSLTTNPTQTLTTNKIRMTATKAAELTKDATLLKPSNSNTPKIDTTAQLLKGLPKSLLEKVRAKQAAKALDQMTRRPSQDQEATIYSRLPDLARHLRNVFISERKGVLTLEIVIKKIQNSFRTCLTAAEIEQYLKLMSKVVPEWVGLHEVRKTMYVKINRDMELKPITEKLELTANEKSK